MNNRFLRVVVCLLVICCLIVNMSPIRAEATTVAVYSVVAVPAIIAIGSILRCLGIGPSADTSAFDNLVNTIIDSLFLGEVLELVTWAVGGFQKYAVPQVLIESVRSYLFDSNTVSYALSVRGAVLGAGRTIQVGSSAFYTTTGYCEVFCAQNMYSGYGNFLFLSKSPFSVNGTASTEYDSTYHYVFFKKVAFDIWKAADNYVFPYSPYGTYSAEKFANLCSNYYQGETLILSSGLVAGTIVSEGLSLADGYVDWYAGAVSVAGTDVGLETEEETTYVPISIAQTYTETIAQTQAQAQTATSTYVDTTTDSYTGLLGTAINWLENIWSAVTGIPASIVSGITDFFTFSTDLSAYAVELTSFFPFCVPWDIYNFFALFLAEPEAPCLEFDIDFPYMNEPWHIVIDLSAWDTVATVLRTLELVLFIVGLAMVTREKFLRG